MQNVSALRQGCPEQTQEGDDGLDDGRGMVAVVLLVTGQKWKRIVWYVVPRFSRAEGVF